METKPTASWTTILTGLFMLVLLVCGYILWQYVPLLTPPAVRATVSPASSPGFEVRYNAIAALANRGSRRAVEPSPEAAAQAVAGLAAPGGFVPAAATLQADDRRTLLAEMLDEDRQLRNFRRQLENGQDLPDELAARTTVVSALKAIAELHRRQPDLDLSALHPAIDRLTRSSNPVVQQQAVRTQSVLGAAAKP